MDFPALFSGLIPKPNQSVCLALNKVLLQVPLRLWQMASFIFSGEVINNSFERLIIKPGDFIFSGSSAARTDALLCDGASYLRSDQPTLFTAIGTVFGSADADHFNVPDYRGRFPVGVGTTVGLKDSKGNDIAGHNYTLGESGGEENHVLTVAELAEHNHMAFKSGLITDSRALDGENAVSERGGFPSENSYNLTRLDDAGVTKPDVGPTSKVGTASSTADGAEPTAGGHNNVPPFLATFIYIKN